jgi:UDP-3-O-[3-hydroxymyristoyl] glucosamine N-acyltransferase
VKNIFDNARVYGNAQVSGNAVVSGDARVSGNAQVFGDAWVFGNAQVSGNAQVFGDAWVFGNAKVSGAALIEKTSNYIVIGPAKSSGRYTTAHRDSVIGVRVNCGCFSGSIDEFINAINETHKDNKEFQKEYLLFVALIKNRFGV